MIDSETGRKRKRLRTLVKPIGIIVLVAVCSAHSKATIDAPRGDSTDLEGQRSGRGRRW